MGIDALRYLPERSGSEKTFVLELESEDTEIVPETAPLPMSTPIPASASHDHAAHSLSKSPSRVQGTPDPIQLQLEQIQENMFTLMTNQHSIMVNQSNMERRLAKQEALMLQILKTLQKGKGNQ